MSRILVVYGSTEGHTRKIAEFVGARLRERGHEAEIVDSASTAARQLQALHDGAIIGGSLHQGQHQTALTHFVKDNAEWLRSLPTAFFSVSLAMASPSEAEHLEARRLARQFVDDSGLGTGLVRCFAGALSYTRYDWFKRMLMRWIASREGGDVDTTKDYEYTDWSDVRAFVDEYLSAAGFSTREAHG